MRWLSRLRAWFWPRRIPDAPRSAPPIASRYFVTTYRSDPSTHIYTAEVHAIPRIIPPDFNVHPLYHATRNYDSLDAFLRAVPRTVAKEQP